MGRCAGGVPARASMAQLAQRVAKRTARIGVIGLGYVGLPLAVEFAKEGFRVTGTEAHLGEFGRAISALPGMQRTLLAKRNQ